MPLSLAESQAVNEIAQYLYDFLPGNPHPYADQNLSFPGAAQKVGLGHLWNGGSKRPAITMLLERTLETRRDLFCNLLLEIVRKGLIYRNNKGNPVTREEIKQLNELILKVKFKVPELWDPGFLDSLPSKQKVVKEEKIKEKISQTDLDKLKDELVKLNDLEPIQRGFAFEKFLQELFSLFELAPRGSFRLVGEQIDGSFQLGTDTYLVEAKWQTKQTSQADLLIFREKVESKSAWSRGLFISYSGFSQDGLTAFSRGRSTNIIGMNSQDIYFVLNEEMSLVDAIIRKARRAAETGEFFVSVYDLSREL